MIAHLETITLENVRFIVQPAGRERTRRTGQRNVHAYVAGTVVEDAELAGERVTYRPFENDTFVRVASGEPIYRAPACKVCSREVWI